MVACHGSPSQGETGRVAYAQPCKSAHSARTIAPQSVHRSFIASRCFHVNGSGGVIVMVPSRAKYPFGAGPYTRG